MNLDIDSLRSSNKFLFNYQLETLLKRGCPKQIINELGGIKDYVFANTSPEPKGIPFIPVIPIEYLGIFGLTNLLKGDFIFSATDFPPRRTRKIRLAYIFDILTGQEMLGKMLQKEMEKKATEGNRSLLDIPDGLALCTHFPNILKKHAIECGEQNSCGFVPVIKLNAERPTLQTIGYIKDAQNYNYAVASCRRTEPWS